MRPQVHTRDELLAKDVELIEWEGRCVCRFLLISRINIISARDPKLVVDADGRVALVLLGRPDSDDWDAVAKEMARVMEGVRRRAVRCGILKAKNLRHRRSVYYSLGSGVTKGPGQKKPGNLSHSKGYRRLVELLRQNPSIRRIIGFQSSGLARYFPKLYKHFCDVLQAIYENQPELEQLFANSVFPAATWNLGPDVVMTDHKDMLNLPYGLCPVTAAGDYDHKTGGHMYLKQLNMLIEFPSGSSMIIPSASVTHSNTAIQKGETRYSMTQYAASELF
ncbi:hypothetical protein B0H13DRAFT_1619090 [Mycena leptocephala]|nr:hypothetical protein B0H13DRAFT_1619090 [Mycena leptocephala]